MLSLLWKPIAALTGIELSFADRQMVKGDGGRTFEKIYEKQYGSVHIPFNKDSFKQAIKDAKDKKAMLVACFVSSIHEANTIFSKETIGDPFLAQQFFNRNDLVFWISDDASDPETMKISESFGLQSYPCIIFFDSIDGKFLPLCRIDGFCNAKVLKDNTEELLNRLAEHRITLEELRENQSAGQRLREEQDLAYKKSLEIDREKEKEKKKIEQREKEQKEKEIKAIKLQDELQKTRLVELARLKKELSNEYDGLDAIKLSLQLPNGQRAIRKFSPSDPVTKLYDWAFTLIGDDLEITFDNFIIRTLMPPVIFEKTPSHSSLNDVGIQNLMKLIIERKD